jgi:hypothetical protein
MTLATAKCISPADPVGIACNLKAMGSRDRRRYNDLMKRIRAAVRNRKTLPDGYAYQLDQKAITLPEVAEWMTLERLCCPFLKLELSATGQQMDWGLTLTGPDGVKPLLQAEVP